MLINTIAQVCKSYFYNYSSLIILKILMNVLFTMEVVNNFVLMLLEITPVLVMLASHYQVKIFAQVFSYYIVGHHNL